MVFVSLTIIPFILLLTQTSQLSRGVYMRSTQSLVFSSAESQMDANRADYYDAFNDTVMSTDIVDSGQTLPFMAVIDTTGSDALNKIAYLYSYRNSTDAVSSPQHKLELFNALDTLRMRCGSASALLDTSNQLWVGDQAYSGVKKQPGYFTAGTTGNLNSDILNATGADDSLFQYWREAANLDYRFDVPNGKYTIMLYFAEMSGVTNRYLNVRLEGSVKNSTPYSVYQTTGGNYLGNILNYDVVVSDGVLNINVEQDASAGANNPRLSGIVVKKRQIQP